MTQRQHKIMALFLAYQKVEEFGDMSNEEIVRGGYVDGDLNLTEEDWNEIRKQLDALTQRLYDRYMNLLENT